MGCHPDKKSSLWIYVCFTLVILTITLMVIATRSSTRKKEVTTTKPSESTYILVTTFIGDAEVESNGGFNLQGSATVQSKIQDKSVLAVWPNNLPRPTKGSTVKLFVVENPHEADGRPVNLAFPANPSLETQPAT